MWWKKSYVQQRHMSDTMNSCGGLCRPETAIHTSYEAYGVSLSVAQLNKRRLSHGSKVTKGPY